MPPFTLLNSWFLNMATFLCENVDRTRKVITPPYREACWGQHDHPKVIHKGKADVMRAWAQTPGSSPFQVLLGSSWAGHQQPLPPTLCGASLFSLLRTQFSWMQHCFRTSFKVRVCPSRVPEQSMCTCEEKPCCLVRQCNPGSWDHMMLLCPIGCRNCLGRHYHMLCTRKLGARYWWLLLPSSWR